MVLIVGVAHKRWSCSAIKGSIGCWISKPRICSNILRCVVIYCVRYALWVTKDGFTLWSLLDLQTFKVFQIHILDHVFEFWLAEKYFKPLWKKWSGQNWTSWTGSSSLDAYLLFYWALIIHCLLYDKVLSL